MVEAPAVTMPVGLEAVVLIPVSICNVYGYNHVAVNLRSVAVARRVAASTGGRRAGGAGNGHGLVDDGGDDGGRGGGDGLDRVGRADTSARSGGNGGVGGSEAGGLRSGH